MAEGWHFEQIPAGQGACDADGQGVTTLKLRGLRGGIRDEEVAVFEAESEPVSLRRYDGNERCLILLVAWYVES